jgi:ribosomal protein S27AE
MMEPDLKVPKPGEACPHCGDGILELSPNDNYLICRKCGRVIVVVKHGPGCH